MPAPPAAPACAAPAPAPGSVSAIFARAERVFELRVDQLLRAKRAKAARAGSAFNARKAKRDARTVAGREKLDALVRRLADLAALQEAALGPAQAAAHIAHLDAAAAALLGCAALADATAAPPPDSPPHHHPPPETSPAHGSPVSPPAFQHPPLLCLHPHRQTAPAPDDPDAAPELLDTSSCSDDASITGPPAPPPLPAFKDLRDPPPDIDDTFPPHHLGPPHHTSDRHIFPATESVVNFVLECDDDAAAAAAHPPPPPPARHMYDMMSLHHHHHHRPPPPIPAYNHPPPPPPHHSYAASPYDDALRRPPPGAPSDWPPHPHSLQSTSSL